MTTLQQMAEGQNSAHVVFNEVAESLSAAGIYGKNHETTTGLVWGYYGGFYNGNTIADGTVALTNTADNYVVVLRSSGVVSASTSSTNSLDPLYAKLYKLTAAGGVVTTTVDQRWDANGLLFNASGASGTLTSLTASNGARTASGTAITTTGVIYGDSVTNAQTGTTYTVLTGDRGKLVTHSNASAIAVTLPQAGASFPDGWYYDTQSVGAGTVTITPTTSTIGGSATLVLTTGQSARIVSDGTNYRALIGGSTGSGTVTATGGSLTANAVVLGAGTTDVKVVAGVTTDGTSAINLGVAGASVGKVVFANATSGTITVQPPTGALGTVTVTVPAATDTLLGKTSATGITAFGIRSTGAAFDLTMATSEVFTAGRTLSWDLADAARSITLGGNLSLAGSLTTSGAFASTFTMTGTTTVTFPTSGTLLSTAAAVTVAQGGTGVATLTAYAPIFAGTTSTGAVQSGTVGTSGQVLTSNGAGALPTFQAASSGGTKTYAFFTPMTSQPPAANYATLDTRNSIAVLDFDDATSESVYWVGVMPEAASLGSGLIVKVHWTATSATTNGVTWGASFERMNTDLDADSFDTETTGSSTTNGTSGIVTVTSITCTTIDSIAAGDAYRLKIARKPSDGSDTMAGDAEIVVVEVRSAA